VRTKRRWKWRPLTEVDKGALWDRRAAGETTTRAAQHLGLALETVRRYVGASGGVRPPPRTRSRWALTLENREEISRGLAAGDSLRAIARRIGRSPSTVSRETARNQGREKYRAASAEQAALARAKRPKPAKLAVSQLLRSVVEAGLQLDWSPRQISRRLKREYPEHPEMQVSAETIYLSLYIQGRGALRKELTKHLRRGHLVRQAKTRLPSRRGHIKDMVNISQRPAEVDDRAVPGHWEGDLLLGTPANAVGTLVERTSRYVMLFQLPAGINAESARQGLTKKIQTLPQSLRRSLTWDQGREMKQHLQFTVDTSVQIYFCDPHSPWQRGTNENTNGLLRQYFPRNKSVAGYSQEDLDLVAAKLNGRPRETLDWMTPAERLSEILEQSSGPSVARTP
jgi:transposase, IS30 family